MSRRRQLRFNVSGILLGRKCCLRISIVGEGTRVLLSVASMHAQLEPSTVVIPKAIPRARQPANLRVRPPIQSVLICRPSRSVGQWAGFCVARGPLGFSLLMGPSPFCLHVTIIAPHTHIYTNSLHLIYVFTGHICMSMSVHEYESVCVYVSISMQKKYDIYIDTYIYIYIYMHVTT